MQEFDLRYDSFYKILRVIAYVITFTLFVVIFPQKVTLISTIAILFISIDIILKVKKTIYFIRNVGSFIKVPITGRSLKIVSFVEPSYVPNTWYGIDGSFDASLPKGGTIHSKSVGIFPNNLRTRELYEAERMLLNLRNQETAFLDEKHMTAYLDTSISPNIKKDLYGLVPAAGMLLAIATAMAYMLCFG